MGDHPNYLHIRCPICSSRRFKVKYPDTLRRGMPCFDYDFRPAHTNTYRIVKCLDCGHGYSSPRPVRFWENYETTEDRVYLRNQRQRLATARKVVIHLRRFSHQGRLLDVGCATGELLSVAQEYFKVEGVEISKWAADIVRSNGFVVHNSELSSIEASEPYDVITLWGVIEHFEEPAREVRNIGRLLRSGGIVGLWTGDFDSCYPGYWAENGGGFKASISIYWSFFIL